MEHSSTNVIENCVPADGINKAMEVPVEFLMPHECTICATRNLETFNIYKTHTSSGVSIHKFLSKFTNIETIFMGSLDEYICKNCLHVANVLEQAEIEYNRAKAEFESIIRKNSLFSEQMPIEILCVKVEPQNFGNECESLNKDCEKTYPVLEMKKERETEDFHNIDYSNELHPHLAQEASETSSNLEEDIGEDIQLKDGAAEKPEAQCEGISTKNLAHQVQKTAAKHECPICLLTFTHKSHLKNHIKTHTSEKSHDCDVCQLRFKDKNELVLHLKTHFNERPYECSFCLRRFIQETHLKEHTKIHTGERPYACTICDQAFYRKKTLEDHILVHTGEKPFRCDVCEQVYRTKHQLDIHTRVHSGQKPYHCKICNNNFTQRAHLRNHLRTHTGEKPFECSICNRKFGRKDTLNSHIKTHTGEKIYKCKVCKVRFDDKSQYDAHALIHPVVKPFVCHLCEKRFDRSSKLQSHLSSLHM